MTYLVDLFERKKRVQVDLEDDLSSESKRAARGDPHSRRAPRPCGMTIHTGVGCSYLCAYCYIYDMGFPAIPKPYPLEPKELVYSLSLNPYVVPERTLAAYGSVTEPLLPETSDRAIGYMREVWRWLKMPTQLSTKSILTNEIVSEILAGDPNANVLITVVTLSNRGLEPKAPDPLKRIEGAGEASKRGLKASLFIRPIIPGVTDREADKILASAADKGIETVVLGSLRVTERIIRKLERRGVKREEIERRLVKPLKGNEQIEVKSSDLKDKIRRMAESLGLKVFRAACEANNYHHGRYCAMCHLGPCNTDVKPEALEESAVRDLLEYLGVPYSDVDVGDEIVVYLKRRVDDGVRNLINTATYRRTMFVKPR
ncbi:MAG: radical SAM protein [Candidatus Bathyarchaeia archaeon]